MDNPELAEELKKKIITAMDGTPEEPVKEIHEEIVDID